MNKRDIDPFTVIMADVFLASVVVIIMIVAVIMTDSFNTTKTVNAVEPESETSVIIATTWESIEQEEETVETVEETEPLCPYTEEEIRLVERVVYAEAGAEPLVGQVAVAATILNRAELRDMTIEQVVYEQNQYASPTKGIVGANTVLAVEKAINDRELFPFNMIYFRTKHYHTYGKPYTVIGSHYFSIDDRYTEGDHEGL